MSSVRLLFAIRLAAAVVLASSSVASADRISEDAWLAEIDQIHAQAQNNSAWDLIETRGLFAAQGRAVRRDKELILNLGDGGQRRYENKDGCNESSDEERCHIFRFVAHLPTRNFFIVDEAFYEGDHYRLVDDRTGRETVVSGKPRFGPDPSVILVIDDDWAYGSDEELQIWRRDNDRAILEWARKAGSEPAPHLIKLIQWATPEEIHLEMTAPESLNHPRWPAELEREQGQWHLKMSPPPAN